MNRVCLGPWREGIGVALERIPARVKERIGEFQIIAGVSPFFVGLYDGREPWTDSESRTNYHATAHVAYPWHVTPSRPRVDRIPTVVLPAKYAARPDVIVHEIGHVLDYRLDFTHSARPVTRYAETNRREAFAEAFMTWLCPEWWEPSHDLLIKDRATVALFEGLTA